MDPREPPSSPVAGVRTMIASRWFKWTAALSVAPFLLVAFYIALFGWNWLRAPLEHQVSRATGRNFAIRGDLEIQLSLHPRIIANEIVFGNAAGSTQPNMAEIRRLDLRIDILQLFAGSTVFPVMALSEPHLLLEVGSDGTPNWRFNASDKNAPIEWPVIGALTIDHGTAIYRDPAIKTDLAFEVKTLTDGKDIAGTGLAMTATGRFKGLPTTLHAQGGALLSLRSRDQPYPLKVSATLGATKAVIDGVLLDPLHLRGEQLNFKVEGGDLAQWYPIIGVPFPPTPEYQLAGFLEHAGDVWTFRRFKGTVGKSDLAGDFAVDRGKHPQMITAMLVSKKLRMKALGGFIGADNATQPDAVAVDSGRVLPDSPFNLEKLRAANADVHFRGDKIFTGKIPLENMNAHLIINDGVLRLAPLDFGLAGGSLVMQLEMDGRQSRIATRAELTAKGLRLERMFPAAKLAAADTGALGGRARLEGGGNSIAQMLGAANGEAALIMDGGSVSELMLRMSNLDIANSIAVMLGGDQQVPIRCLVGDFKAINGDFTVDALLLDTPKVNITGSGDVTFTDETLHLRLVSQSKGFSLASLRGPIAISGTFRNPAVHPEMGGVMARGGLALALGAVTAGLGALIPLLDFGKGRTREGDSRCALLMNQARADVGVKAGDLLPPAGK